MADPFGGEALGGGAFDAPAMSLEAADPSDQSGACAPLEAEDADLFDEAPPAPRRSAPFAAAPPPITGAAKPGGLLGGFFGAAKDALGLGGNAPTPPPAVQPSAPPHPRLGAPIPLRAMGQAPRAPVGDPFGADGPSAGGADAFSGYRRRAEDLVRLLAAQVSSTIERQRELGRLIVLLERLLDDLRSVGAPGHLVRPLEDLVRELEVIRRHAAGQLDDRELGRLWQRAADVLQGYVRGVAPAPAQPTIQPPTAGGGRREFWK